MTRDGLSGVFIPGRVLGVKRLSQWERRMTGRGGWVYKPDVIGGRYIRASPFVIT